MKDVTEPSLQSLAVDFFEKGEEGQLVQVELEHSLLLSMTAHFFGREAEERLLRVEMEEFLLLSMIADFFGEVEEQLLQVETGRLDSCLL